MHQRNLTLLIAMLALVLAACSGNVGSTPDPVDESSSPSPTASPSPSEPSAPDSDGTFAMVDGVAVGGPGIGLAEAIASGTADPTLVNGVLLMDLDGAIWLCDSLTDDSTPECAGASVRVLNYPEATGDWDIANADVTGLRESGGVLYFESAQLYGVVGA